MIDEFDESKLEGHRDGATYDADLDYEALNKQCKDVYRAIQDGDWHTLDELAVLTGHPQPSISARLRDLRKKKYGSHIIERQRAGFGGRVFEYRYGGRA